MPRRLLHESRRRSDVTRPGYPALIALIAICLLVGAGRSAADPTHGPDIVLDPPAVDFGILEPHQTVEQEIVIKNNGDEALYIEEVKPTCGCTVAELTKQNLQPGESTVLNITFHSEKFQGPQTKVIEIFSNDPNTPELEYEISAVVHVPVIVRPKRKLLGFGILRKGETRTDQAIFQAMDLSELRIDPVRYDEDIFDIRLIHAYEDDPQKVAMDVTVKPTATIGEHREYIQLRTNDPNMARIDFELFVDVVQDLIVDKKKINFMYAHRDKQLEERVRISATSKTLAFKVTGAQIDLPGFQARVEETVPNRENVVTITGMPLATDDPRAKAANGRMKGTLKIFTDLPSQPEIEVQVIYLLRL